MQFVKKFSEEEMVALFLKSEIGSNRWRPCLLEILEDLKCPIELLEDPDTTRSEHNELRAMVLARFRGYGENRKLFKNYPDGVKWQWILLDRIDLTRTKYVNYSYWNEITGGSRRPTDAAETIRKGIEVYGVSNRNFLEGAEVVRKGAIFAEPILVAPDPAGDLVILEVHGRITIYAVAGQRCTTNDTVHARPVDRIYIVALKCHDLECGTISSDCFHYVRPWHVIRTKIPFNQLFN